MRNRLTQDKPTLFLDQHGGKTWASSLTELRKHTGYSHTAKIYVDDVNGAAVWIGYVIGPLWLTAYRLLAVVQL